MTHTQTKFSLSHAITTIAISVAEKAVISGSTCIGLVYEPKVPEALKKEVEK
ncbi:cyclic lactone autoinducer peptide [Enterococcus faecium]|uniref:cyclic lactone autoinducer peptide n=1 Tax=Enterococcus TaxID=1350 RepID=UPI000CF2180A|nr:MULTISPECIES: cyclic lactone autoinducer peptide [Enterococcus]PQF00527.1 cyclic lactone autoinducer peptide [Enterococcus faecium]PQF25719.1 cyclic lactone autoinducer peptide [Enterococcus faecium]PQG66323.1 cyclic lactone autoinducer peptide [Enterococcus faecium]